MAHRTKKDQKKRELRGPTFVGLAPRIEDGKHKKQEKLFAKHKNKRFSV